MNEDDNNNDDEIRDNPFNGDTRIEQQIEVIKKSNVNPIPTNPNPNHKGKKKRKVVKVSKHGGISNMSNMSHIGSMFDK